MAIEDKAACPWACLVLLTSAEKALPLFGYRQPMELLLLLLLWGRKALPKTLPLACYQDRCIQCSSRADALREAWVTAT